MAVILTIVVIKIIPSFNRYIVFIIIATTLYFTYTRTSILNFINKIT